ncbi:MAG TPA: S24 family peptidase [Nocardioidaceae bacterium]|nr:S24 family peptidase [Nocardioidaceae bacterium]
MTSREQGKRSGPRRLGVAVVRGRSMQPTLYDGDRLLVVHGARPRAGTLAVVRLPDGTVAVKRVTRREADGWWVERDNPSEGVDSWSVGAIRDEDVLARVLVRFWPVVRRVSHPPHPGGPAPGV